MALCCIPFSMITYLLYWRTQNGHNDQCVVSTVLNWGEGTSPSICWQYLSRYPGYHYVIFWCFFLSASFISDSHSAHWPPGPLRSVSVDLLSSLMALSMSWCLRLFFHSSGLCISPCWTSWCSSQSSSPAWQCLSSGWQHDYPVHLPLHLVLCHLKTCWGYTLFHPPKVNENVKHFQSSFLIVFHIYQLCPDIQKGQNHNENCGKRKKERSPINALIWRKNIYILSSHL